MGELSPPSNTKKWPAYGRPNTGFCVECKRVQRYTWHVESIGIRLCLPHIKAALDQANAE